MKKISILTASAALFLSINAHAGSIKSINCFENSITFQAQASLYDRVYTNKLYIQLTTNTPRTYTKTQEFTLTQMQTYAFDFDAMITNSGYSGAYGVNYSIFDAFGSINKTGSCY